LTERRLSPDKEIERARRKRTPTPAPSSAQSPPGVHSWLGEDITLARHILVVDDEPDLRELLGVILEWAGYQVTRAADGREALARVKEGSFDLVILDIMMPGLDGWEVCQRLKTSEKTRRLPVILLTIRSQPMDKVVGLDVLRADAYLTKPFDCAELLAKVESLIGQPEA